MLGWKPASPKIIRKLPGGLIGKRLRFSEALVRPAPAKKISAASSAPKSREVHTANMSPMSQGGKIFQPSLKSMNCFPLARGLTNRKLAICPSVPIPKYRLAGGATFDKSSPVIHNQDGSSVELEI
jgi:hypothetical protein